MDRRGRSQRPCAEYSATCGHTSVVGGISVLRQAHGFAVNQGGTADRLYSSLTEVFSVGDFLFSPTLGRNCDAFHKTMAHFCVKPKINDFFCNMEDE